MAGDWTARDRPDAYETRRRFKDVLAILDAHIPDRPTLLNYDTPFHLLVAVILSAQTTDEQVNRVTPELFARYPGAGELAEAEASEVEDIIRTTGYFRSKAKRVIGAARVVRDRYGGQVPETMEELIAIPGAGRKTAGVILHHLYGKPAIIVDTHFGRVSRRLGFASSTDPTKLEMEIAGVVDPAEWGNASMLLNYHGRRTCTARSPRCSECAVASLCPKVGV